MNKINLFFILVLSCFEIATAQTGKINGKAVSGGKPLESAIVTLLLSKDNSLVKTEIAQTDGSFEFNNLKAETYIIAIDNPGYKMYQSQPIEIAADKFEITVPVITVEALETNKLEEVVVQKKKAIIENKIDKTVVNVDAMLTTAGGDAMDVLEKSPGIIVDQNGTITFKGKSGVAVFIDDKPTYLSGSDLEAYLKSLPASTLNQIELMTNPPAKYDAAGGAGVINIVTKKSKARGFNGSATARVSQGKHMFARSGLNLNYLNDKVRVFGNIGYGHVEPSNNLYIYRRFKNEDLTLKNNFDQNSFLKNKVNTGNVNLGFDYYASEKTTFGIALSGIIKSGKKTSNVTSEFSNAFSVVDSTIIANNTEKDKFTNGGINLNFRHDLNDKGQKITVDADYLNYGNTTDQTFMNSIYLPDGVVSSSDQSVGYLPSDIDIYSFKTDYELPLKKEGSFAAGYKMSISKTDNIADFRDVMGGNEIPNYDMSNHFKYDEVIHAGYVNYNTTFRRFTFQTGLRVENTESKGNQLGNFLKPASQFKKTYTNLFPTIYVQYKLDSIGNNQLVASYGKRINRPYYEDLNPFISPLDKFTFYAGNPYLNPAFAHNYEFSYRYKSYFSTTLSYGNSKDEINETIEIKDEIYYYSRPGNIGKSNIYSFNVNADIPFAKWLRTSIYSEITYTEYKSKLYTENLNSSGTYWFISANNSFKFPKDWSAELSGNYTSTVVSAQFTLGARGNVSLGIQKKIMQGKASVKLSANDIFYTGINTGTINNLHLTDATWVNKADTRFVALTFTYSFGKAFQTKDHEATGADSEKNRVKN
ncbi:MAG TPA: TonB-dependent receptor [Flavobacterium sp.]|nr:TonB-dependent receptor [Flavobacterium sp.]